MFPTGPVQRYYPSPSRYPTSNPNQWSNRPGYNNSTQSPYPGYNPYFKSAPFNDPYSQPMDMSMGYPPQSPTADPATLGLLHIAERRFSDVKHWMTCIQQLRKEIEVKMRCAHSACGAADFRAASLLYKEVDERVGEFERTLGMGGGPC